MDESLKEIQQKLEKVLETGYGEILITINNYKINIRTTTSVQFDTKIK